MASAEPDGEGLQRLLAGLVALEASVIALRVVKKRRRQWIRPVLARRKEKSVYYNLVAELQLEDQDSLRAFHRMGKDLFNNLLRKIEPHISKLDSRWRKAVTPGERLSLTLRHLATGESLRSLEFQYRVSHSLISSIIPEVCIAIYEVLNSDYMKVPCCSGDWLNIAREFERLWDFPHCVGALDGKRVRIRKPHHSGSEYYDYQGRHSIIGLLLALVNANHKFIVADTGIPGRASDAGVWDRCAFRKMIDEGHSNFPAPCNLPNSIKTSPFVIVDDAFPLKTYLMKPYPGKHLKNQELVFNYRLSRARRLSENAFGILTAKFRIYKGIISTSHENIPQIILATMVLHNFLKVEEKGYFDLNDIIHSGGLNPESAGVVPLRQIARKGAGPAKEVREMLTNYFNNEGRVHWQERALLNH